MTVQSKGNYMYLSQLTGGYADLELHVGKRLWPATLVSRRAAESWALWLDL